MNNIVPESVEAEDYFKYYCADEKAKGFWLLIQYRLEAAETEESAKAREIELLREQLYFARELVAALESGLQTETRLITFKKTFARLLADSYFEL